MLYSDWSIRKLLSFFLKNLKSSKWLLICNGKLLKILQPEYSTPLWTIVRFTEGKWKLKLCQVLKLWISLFYRNKLLFSATNISIEYMYWDGRVSISNSLKRFLQDSHLDLLVRILITLFCILKMSLVTCALPRI